MYPCHAKSATSIVSFLRPGATEAELCCFMCQRTVGLVPQPQAHLYKVCWAGNQDRQCSGRHARGDLDVQARHIGLCCFAAHESSFQRVVHAYPQAPV